MKRVRIHQGQAGFTLIELMIATMVFSVVLLMVTFGILQITRVYFKGVTESNTQNVARNIIDTISQAIQFSGGTVVETTSGTATPSAPKAFCIGDQQFVYALGWQLKDNSPNNTIHQSYHGLVSDTVSNCNSTPAQNLDSPGISGRELLSPNMRITKLDVSQDSPGVYSVDVRVVYGDDDLLDNPTDPNATCQGVSAGTQFCSVSELSTIVVKRVQ